MKDNDTDTRRWSNGLPIVKVRARVQRPTFAQTVYADLTDCEAAADVMPDTLFPSVVPF